MVITEQRELARWQKGGEDKVIFEVDAVNEEGAKINRKLRTFHPELPLGELIEFEVAEYIHQEHGQTFTLKLPAKGRASKKEMNEMKNQLNSLAERMAALETEVPELRAEVARLKPLDPAKVKTDDDRWGPTMP